MVTKKRHRYEILQAIDMPREQHDDLTSKYLPYEPALRKAELVEICVRVWEVTGATMPDDGRDAFEELNAFGVRSSIAAAVGFDYTETIDERDGAKIVDRNHGDKFTKAELRKVREPLDFPHRWLDGEYIGPEPAGVSKTVTGPAHVRVQLGDGYERFLTLDTDDELDIEVEIGRDGGVEGDA